VVLYNVAIFGRSNFASKKRVQITKHVNNINENCPRKYDQGLTFPHAFVKAGEKVQIFSHIVL